VTESSPLDTDRGQSAVDTPASSAPRRGVLASRRLGFWARTLPWRTRLQLRGFLHYSLWFLPLIGMGVGVLLGALLPRIDESTGADLGLEFSSSAAEASLAGVAGGTITLVGFSYTITALVLQVQYAFSPRLMRVLIRCS
jgi:uncharacterized membrane protein